MEQTIVPDYPPPAKRAKLDLASTFDVLVGGKDGDGSSPQRFTLYTNVFIPRCEFFRAARSSQWLSDPKAPVDLTDEDPETWSCYMNCVYFGIETLQVASLEADIQLENQIEGEDEDEIYDQNTVPDAFDLSEKEMKETVERDAQKSTQMSLQVDQHITLLVKSYLLADKLQDSMTGNIVMDEIIRFCRSSRRNFGDSAIRLAYNATAHGHPLRRLIRDSTVYKTLDRKALNFHLHAHSLPPDFYRDVAIESWRHVTGRAEDRSYNALARPFDMVEKNCKSDECRYHYHSEQHPRCVPKPELDSETTFAGNGGRRRTKFTTMPGALGGMIWL